MKEKIATNPSNIRYGKIFAPKEQYNNRQLEVLGLAKLANPLVDILEETLVEERNLYRFLKSNMTEDGVIYLYGCSDRRTRESLGVLTRLYEKGKIEIYNEKNELINSFCMIL